MSSGNAIGPVNDGDSNSGNTATTSTAKTSTLANNNGFVPPSANAGASNGGTSGTRGSSNARGNTGSKSSAKTIHPGSEGDRNRVNTATTSPAKTSTLDNNNGFVPP